MWTVNNPLVKWKHILHYIYSNGCHKYKLQKAICVYYIAILHNQHRSSLLLKKRNWNKSEKRGIMYIAG